MYQKCTNVSLFPTVRMGMGILSPLPSHTQQYLERGTEPDRCESRDGCPKA